MSQTAPEPQINREDSKMIAKILLEFKSMPFLELAAVSGLEHRRLSKALAELEKLGFVKITDPESVIDEIVTLRESSFDLLMKNGLTALGS